MSAWQPLMGSEFLPKGRTMVDYQSLYSSIKPNNVDNISVTVGWYPTTRTLKFNAGSMNLSWEAELSSRMPPDCTQRPLFICFFQYR